MFKTKFLKLLFSCKSVHPLQKSYLNNTFFSLWSFKYSVVCERKIVKNNYCALFTRYDDASRFWVPERDEDDKIAPVSSSSEEVASLTRRTFTYTGDFEPVEWKCRAPLNNGKLCERMDRNKVWICLKFILL